MIRYRIIVDNRREVIVDADSLELASAAALADHPESVVTGWSVVPPPPAPEPVEGGDENGEGE